MALIEQEVIIDEKISSSSWRARQAFFEVGERCSTDRRWRNMIVYLRKEQGKSGDSQQMGRSGKAGVIS